jgi:uncharacterized membrane-anchored protein
MRKVSKILMGIILMILLVGSTAFAASGNNDAEVKRALKAARNVQQVGPTEIKLQDQAVINLPKGFVFIPQPEAGKLSGAWGNSNSKELVGLIFSDNDKDNYMVVVKYFSAGYIKDDDAKNWDTKELFNGLKEGTEKNNEERVKKGIPELEIIGWVQEPKYDADKKQLVWAMSAKDKGSESATNKHSINYNTYILGREGYLTMNLVTSLDKIDLYKPAIGQLLGSTAFVDGKKYTDFNSSTDKVAEYGLAALVAGVAVKKLGFFALMAAFALKWIKLLIVAVVGGGALLAKFFGKKKKEEPTVEQDVPIVATTEEATTEKITEKKE